MKKKMDIKMGITEEAHTYLGVQDGQSARTLDQTIKQTKLSKLSFSPPFSTSAQTPDQTIKLTKCPRHMGHWADVGQTLGRHWVDIG